MRRAPQLIPPAFTLLVAVVLYLRGTDPLMFVYNVAIAWPFASFVAERLRLLSASTLHRSLLDVAVVLVSLARVHPAVRGYSGHVLFLGYAAVTGTTATRIPALIALCGVIVAKLGVWRDVITPAGAAALLATALVARALLQRRGEPPRPSPPPFGARKGELQRGNSDETRS